MEMILFNLVLHYGELLENHRFMFLKLINCAHHYLLFQVVTPIAPLNQQVCPEVS